MLLNSSRHSLRMLIPILTLPSIAEHPQLMITVAMMKVISASGDHCEFLLYLSMEEIVPKGMSVVQWWGIRIPYQFGLILIHLYSAIRTMLHHFTKDCSGISCHNGVFCMHFQQQVSQSANVATISKASPKMSLPQRPDFSRGSDCH